MSSGEKILSVIRMDSQEAIAQMQAETDKKCESILRKAKDKAQEISNNAQQKKAEQMARLQKSHQSRRELEKRNMILKAKRTAINEAVVSVLDYMEHLESKEYFALIYRLAATLGAKEGVVLLNEKDLKRVPKDFIQQMAKSGIKAALSPTPDNSIKSGFILKNGDIEENMSFAAVIADRREAVEDVINRELFKG